MSLAGLAVLAVMLAAVALVALWPYLDRWRGGAGATPDDEAAARSRRLTIILFTVAFLGLAGVGLRVASDRALDGRERDLRREIADAGPRKLEDVRALLRDPDGSLEAARELDELTSGARIGVRGITPAEDEPTVAFAQLDWLWASRCYLLTIEPGGDHTLVRDDC